VRAPGLLERDSLRDQRLDLLRCEEVWQRREVLAKIVRMPTTMRVWSRGLRFMTMCGIATPVERIVATLTEGISMYRRLGLALALASFAVTVRAAPLTIDVMQTSESSLFTSITLIKGEKGAVLVDAPFTRADAHRVVAWIIESGKNLEAVYVTHDHPDHFYSMEVITQAFPDARVYSAPQVVTDIWKSIPLKIKRWSPMLGANGPRYPTAPAPLEEGVLMLEGERIEVVGPMQGDHVHSTALWVPSAQALIAGDLLFNDVHLWLGESQQAERKAWAASVDRLAAYDATTVIAGHKKPGLPDDRSSLEFTKNYLARFEEAVAQSTDSAALRARINAAFPQTIDLLGDFILSNSSRVAMGEDPPWQE
jgi:glyoxylase-like metal-dependent hydrolase (beta-lactamase superfamily II)